MRNACKAVSMLHITKCGELNEKTTNIHLNTNLLSSQSKM